MVRKSQSVDRVTGPKHVWTIVITGGDPFRLTLIGNPTLDHQGERTVWKVVGTADMAKRVVDIAKTLRCKADFWTEEETPEQCAERAAILDGTWKDPLVGD